MFSGFAHLDCYGPIAIQAPFHELESFEEPLLIDLCPLQAVISQVLGQATLGIVGY